jgi:hypothetical protein
LKHRQKRGRGVWLSAARWTGVPITEVLARTNALCPTWLNDSRRVLSNLRMSDVMPVIDVMPMTTRSTVSAQRILFVCSVSIDVVISPSNPERIAAIWFAIPYHGRCRSHRVKERCHLIAGRRERNLTVAARATAP